MSLIPNFNLICRTCLAESKDLKSIFLLDSIFEERFSCLKDLLMSFASIQVTLFYKKFSVNKSIFRLLKVTACQKTFV